MADLALIVTLVLIEGRELLLDRAQVVCSSAESHGRLDQVQIPIFCQNDVFLYLFNAYLQIDEHVDDLEFFIRCLYHRLGWRHFKFH